MVRGRGARRPQTLAAVHARHVPEANNARAAARLSALTVTRTDARQGCQACSNARTLMPEQLSSGLLEEVYRNRSHGLTPMERVPGPPIPMPRAKTALPWRKRCLPRRSRWARRSQQLFRAPSSGRGSSMLQAGAVHGATPSDGRCRGVARRERAVSCAASRVVEDIMPTWRGR